MCLQYMCVYHTYIKTRACSCAQNTRVCVRVRMSQQQQQQRQDKRRQSGSSSASDHHSPVCVCVCVCSGERERQRERERKRARERECRCVSLREIAVLRCFTNVGSRTNFEHSHPHHSPQTQQSSAQHSRLPSPPSGGASTWMALNTPPPPGIPGLAKIRESQSCSKFILLQI